MLLISTANRYMIAFQPIFITRNNKKSEFKAVALKYL